MTVTSTTAETRDWPSVLEASGAILPWQEATVAARVAGLPLVEVRADVGDVVRRGQLLARYDDATVRADLARAEAALSQAQASAQAAEANRDRALGPAVHRCDQRPGPAAVDDPGGGRGGAGGPGARRADLGAPRAHAHARAGARRRRDREPQRDARRGGRHGHRTLPDDPPGAAAVARGTRRGAVAARHARHDRDRDAARRQHRDREGAAPRAGARRHQPPRDRLRRPRTGQPCTCRDVCLGTPRGRTSAGRHGAGGERRHPRRPQLRRDARRRRA